MDRQEILLALADGDRHALGNVWRITAKKTDFYIDPWGVGDETGLHLSAHGPNERHPDGHRFHVKIDSRRAGSQDRTGRFLQFSIPRNGLAFDGVPVGNRAWQIARLRWTWDLQRPRFRAAALSGIAPGITDNRQGYVQRGQLQPNEAWDVDLVISYDEPFWPDPHRSKRNGAQIGPLQNEAGLWLTGTSYGMSRLSRPTPEGIVTPPPRRGESPNRIMCGGLEDIGAGDMYWFVETITSREFLETNQSQGA